VCVCVYGVAAVISWASVTPAKKIEELFTLSQVVGKIEACIHAELQGRPRVEVQKCNALANCFCIRINTFLLHILVVSVQGGPIKSKPLLNHH